MKMQLINMLHALMNSNTEDESGKEHEESNKNSSKSKTGKNIYLTTEWC